MPELILETVHHLKVRTGFEPETGIVLGSGLGRLADKMEVAHRIPYSSIPHFPVSTITGHGGNLILGNLNGRAVAALQGRFHCYEGYSPQEVTFPVRVLKHFGIRDIILSNAAGGVNPDYRVGDLMILEDHINLMGVNPLTGRNDEYLGPRFPDMSAPYDADRIGQAGRIAERYGYRCHVGVYAAVQGPCYETRAEYCYIRALGADAVGMSTVPEAIVARHMGLSCFAVSVITDLGGGPEVHAITHEEVVRHAAAAEDKVSRLVGDLLAKS